MIPPTPLLFPPLYGLGCRPTVSLFSGIDLLRQRPMPRSTHSRDWIEARLKTVYDLMAKGFPGLDTCVILPDQVPPRPTPTNVPPSLTHPCVIHCLLAMLSSQESMLNPLDFRSLPPSSFRFPSPPSPPSLPPSLPLPLPNFLAPPSSLPLSSHTHPTAVPPGITRLPGRAGAPGHLHLKLGA